MIYVPVVAPYRAGGNLTLKQIIIIYLDCVYNWRSDPNPLVFGKSNKTSKISERVFKKKPEQKIPNRREGLDGGVSGPRVANEAPRVVPENETEPHHDPQHP